MNCVNRPVRLFTMVLIAMTWCVGAQAAGYMKLGDIKGMFAPDDGIPNPAAQLYSGFYKTSDKSSPILMEIAPLGGISPTMTPDGGWAFDSFFDITYRVELELPDGSLVERTGIGTSHVAGTAPAGGSTRLFDTEMLLLDISGLLDPMSPFTIRESPTLASTGKTTIESLPGGQFHIDGFFDVFAELSFDGGQTWEPMLGVPEPSTLALMALAGLGIVGARRWRSVD